MMTYVAKLINLFASTIQGILYIAWVIGKVIVDLSTAIWLIVFNIVKSVLLFFQILYEDNVSLVTEELPDFTNNIIGVITDQLTHIMNAVNIIYHDIVCYKACAIVESTKWFIKAVITIVSEVLNLIKTVLLLIGDTLWFIITFIPVHLPQLLRVLFNNVIELIISKVVDAYMELLKITNFLTDVPLQSFIGIMSAIVIVRLSVHYREAIQTQAISFYWSIVRKVWYYYYTFYNYFVDPDMREITRMSGGQEPVLLESQSPPDVIDDVNGADALCIICQERQKCVLTLPCRHVCLCTECCMRLYGYQRTCPICRTFIYHSVTVYL